MEKNNSVVGMVAFVVAIAHNHMSLFIEQSILTCRAGFANRRRRIREAIPVRVCEGGGGICNPFYMHVYIVYISRIYKDLGYAK